MKIEEIRTLNTEELKKQLETAHKDLFDLRFQLATKQLVNHRQIRNVKRDIARFNTIIKEKAEE